MSRRLQSQNSKRAKSTEINEDEQLPESGNDTFTLNSSTYIGDWKRFDGVVKRHGYGKYTEPDFSYEGGFEEDLFSGHGILKYHDFLYEGDFLKGEMTGKGEAVFEDGSKYKGEWYNSRMHGIGTFITIDGSKWTGSWCHGNSTCPIFPQVQEEEEDIKSLDESEEINSDSINSIPI
ncbi:putative MORN repeat-containing protein [Histomonas meleagridis]|uniref:putative MORN repeat-containing protein n=1 Tax=Histomonas meleagridis TaxID=135588 RepID=UPI00355A706F|nr:putative MORN repeat-containing protein [Histomonas meleagridis]KAH0797907.1 putative MORN repeat-containing protein [Histomonas meleagridis]